LNPANNEGMIWDRCTDKSSHEYCCPHVRAKL